MTEASITPGSQVGGYLVEGVIGQGGFGLVYSAYHERLKRRAAIKILHGMDPDGLARFEREAQAVARLRHPSILSVFDFGEVGGRPYMVSEFMSGGSLDQHMGGQPQAAPAALALLRPLAEALDYAHSAGIVHRDVKPANVFLDATGRPVLADFGLSKLVGGADAGAQSSMIAGSPSYIAPEQALGKVPSGATDQYALAVVAFHLLTGELPYAAETPMALLYMHIHDPVPPASGRNPALPSSLDGVLTRALAKDPIQRWPSCLAFVQALEAALGGASEPAEPTIWVAPVPAMARRSRRRPLAIAAVVLVAALAAAGAVAWARANQTAAPALALGATSVPVGATLQVTGSGFPAGEALTLQVDETAVGTDRSGASGAVRFRSVLPATVLAGDHEVRACWSAASCTPAVKLAVTGPDSAQPAPAPALVVETGLPLHLDTTITVTGSGLTPGQDARVGLLQNHSTAVITLSPKPFKPAADGHFSQAGLVIDSSQVEAGVPTLLIACNVTTTPDREQSDFSKCLQLQVEVAR